MSEELSDEIFRLRQKLNELLRILLKKGVINQYQYEHLIYEATL